VNNVWRIAYLTADVFGVVQTLASHQAHPPKERKTGLHRYFVYALKDLHPVRLLICAWIFLHSWVVSHLVLFGSVFADKATVLSTSPCISPSCLSPVSRSVQCSHVAPRFSCSHWPCCVCTTVLSEIKAS
jgi:hypothetical protein